MLLNIFPRPLNALIGRTYPRHRFSVVMLPLVSYEEFTVHMTKIATKNRLFEAEELLQAERLGTTKRRDEWLTGRICAKLAARQYLPDGASVNGRLQPDGLAVVNHTSGRPAFSGSLPGSLQGADLSLSHGDGFALALVADSYCGIDIQRPRKTLQRVREKFCADTEEELLRDTFPELSEMQQLTLLWSAKEAAKKAIGFRRMPGFSEFLLTGHAPHAGGWVLTFLVSSRNFDGYPQTVSIVCELYQEYGIAVCLTEEARHA